MDLALNQFTFDVKTKIVYGAGVHQQAGSICRDLGLGRALLITDPVLVKNGLVDKVTGCLLYTSRRLTGPGSSVEDKFPGIRVIREYGEEPGVDLAEERAVTHR